MDGCPTPTLPDVCVDAYAATLRDLRGLAPSTLRQHRRTARDFLTHLAYDHAPAGLAAVTAQEVETFLRCAGARLSRASLQHTVAELRSFLRFLATQGGAPRGLDLQIDTPRCYRLEQLPRALPWATVRAFLAAIDRTTRREVFLRGRAPAGVLKPTGGPRGVPGEEGSA